MIGATSTRASEFMFRVVFIEIVRALFAKIGVELEEQHFNGSHGWPRSLGQRRRGGVLQGRCQPLRVSGRDHPVRHWILRVVQGDLDGRLDVGPQH